MFFVSRGLSKAVITSRNCKSCNSIVTIIAKSRYYVPYCGRFSLKVVVSFVNQAATSKRLLSNYSYSYSYSRYCTINYLASAAVSATINMSSQVQTPSVSSALMTCQIDSYARKSMDRVLAVGLVANEEDVSKPQRFVVTLDNSVLYPEGGGQPSDYGTVHGEKILDIKKSPASAIATAVDVIFEAPFPIEAGLVVESIVDWPRRYDFMQQHTAQHLMSAIAQKIFDAETVGWNLGPDSVTVDLAIASLSQEQIDRLEIEINDFIATGVSVSFDVVGKDYLGSLEHLRGAPKGAAAELESLRIVGIAGLDRNPCGGTHLRSVSEIQLLKFIGLEKVKDVGVRIRFVAGKRAMTFIRTNYQRITALSASLSIPSDDLLATVEKISADKKDLSKALQSWEEQASALIGYVLASQLPLNSSSSDSTEHSPLAYHYSPIDLNKKGATLPQFVNVNFLLSLADVIQGMRPNALIYLSAYEEPSSVGEAASASAKKKPPIKPAAAGKFAMATAFTSLELNSTATTTSASAAANSRVVGVVGDSKPGIFVIVGSATAVEARKAALLDAVSGKGGGRPGRFQGTGLVSSNVDRVKEILK